MIHLKSLLLEKLIVFNNGANYGQAVIVMGGTGSGKGFAISNYLDSSKFKVLDMDELKIKLKKLDAIKNIDLKKLYSEKNSILGHDESNELKYLLFKKYKGIKISQMNMKNHDHVGMLHSIIRMLGWNDSIQNLLLFNNKILPNVILDTTGASRRTVRIFMLKLKNAGYTPENIHVIWVLTDYLEALMNNKNRDRVVPSKLFNNMQYSAKKNIPEFLTTFTDLEVNGRVDIIINNKSNTKFYTDSQVVKDFEYINIKKENKPWPSAKSIEKIINPLVDKYLGELN